MPELPSLGYLIAVLVIVFTITVALRALPFALLQPLRESQLVQTMARWMPVGILAILAAASFHTSTLPPSGTGDAAIGGHGHLLAGVVAVTVTAAAHLLLGRRTLLSVGLGTLTFVALVNLL